MKLLLLLTVAYFANCQDYKQLADAQLAEYEACIMRNINCPPHFANVTDEVYLGAPAEAERSFPKPIEECTQCAEGDVLCGKKCVLAMMRVQVYEQLGLDYKKKRSFKKRRQFKRGIDFKKRGIFSKRLFNFQ